jgi:hypothetical protein
MKSGYAFFIGMWTVRESSAFMFGASMGARAKNPSY